MMLRSSLLVWYAVTSGSPAGVLIVMSTAADPTCVRSGVYTCNAGESDYSGKELTYSFCSVYVVSSCSTPMWTSKICNSSARCKSVLTRTPVSSWTSISAVLTLSDGRLPAAATDSRMTFH